MKKVLFYAIVAMILPVSCNCQSEQKAEGNSEYANDAIAAIMERRSIRQYADTPVPHDTLELIVTCGINAPSGMNGQPWEVRVVEDAAFISETTEAFRAAADPEMLAHMGEFKTMYRNAPSIIVVATPEGKGALDAGLLGENMAIAAQSLGLGTCFLGGPVGFFYTEAGAPYLEKLDLPDGYAISYILAVGYPEESPEAKPRDATKVKYI